MQKEVIDINVILENSILELKMGDEVYVVKDVPLEVLLQSMEPEKGDRPIEILHRQFSKIVNVPYDSIKHLGLKSVTLAIEEIRRWMFMGSAEDNITDVGTSGGGPANP